MDTKIKDFESALTELETIVKTLEDGQLTLEQSLENFERGIELSRFLLHNTAIFNNIDLPHNLVGDGLLNKPDRVHIFDFSPRTQPFARMSNRDVHIRPHTTLLHITVAGP